MKRIAPRIIALIPARSGSKRIKDKNIKPLNGHPLIAYTISAALDSGIFSRIIVSTDSKDYADIATYYGAEVPFLRPLKYATFTSPDIEWVKFTLTKLKEKGEVYDCFSILRPTSPFRTGETIKRAWRQFLVDAKAESLRAVELCQDHPAKMWIVDEKSNRMQSVMVNPNKNNTPWHSQQYASLPKVYAQNASLEIAWTKVVFLKNSISGTEIMPFITREYEGFDLNYESDFIYAEYLLKKGKMKLPRINL